MSWNDDLLRLVNENRKLLGLPPMTQVEVAPACPRCAALESEVRRLREREMSRGELVARNRERARHIGERDSARALLADLAAAARTAEEVLSKIDLTIIQAGEGHEAGWEWLNSEGVEVTGGALGALRKALRRVDAEAGGGAVK